MGQTSIFNRWTGYWDLSAVVSKCLIPPANALRLAHKPVCFYQLFATS